VRDCPGALYLEVERFASPSATALPHPAARHAHAAGGSGGGGGMHGGAGMGGGGMGGGNDGGGNEGLDNVLGSVKNGWEQLGRQLHNFMERPDVTELRVRGMLSIRRHLWNSALTACALHAGPEEPSRSLRAAGCSLAAHLEQLAAGWPAAHPERRRITPLACAPLLTQRYDGSRPPAQDKAGETSQRLGGQVPNTVIAPRPPWSLLLCSPSLVLRRAHHPWSPTTANVSQLNEFGQKAGEGFKNWFDETRGQVEERGLAALLPCLLADLLLTHLLTY
jgi:hypothetical protein